MAPVGIFFFQHHVNKAWQAMAAGDTVPAVEPVAGTVSAAEAPAEPGQPA